MDSVDIWAELEAGNIGSIASIVGDATVILNMGFPGTSEFVLNHFPEAFGCEWAERTVTLDIGFWYDLAEERYRWDSNRANEQWKTTIAAQDIIKSVTDLQIYTERHLCADTYHLRFPPFLKSPVPESDNIRYVRTAFLKQGPSSTALMLGVRKQAVTIPYLYSGDICSASPNMLGLLAKMARNVIVGRTPLPDTGSDQPRLFELEQMRFHEQHLESELTRYYIEIIDEGDQGYILSEWLVDLDIPVCVSFRQASPHLPVRVHYEWIWEDFDNISFPTSVRFRNYRLEAGKELDLWRHELRLSNIHINEPIDEKRFAIEDLGLEDGDYVRDETNDITFPVIGLSDILDLHF